MIIYNMLKWVDIRPIIEDLYPISPKNNEYRIYISNKSISFCFGYFIFI